MPYSLDDKLVITVSSRALFDLEKENRIYKTKGLKKYRIYQRRNEKKILKPGPAFGLVKKLLNLNAGRKEPLVEVVIVSRNDADTGIRIFNSIRKYKLDITRAAFTNGPTKYDYLKTFQSKLYLSANGPDVKKAIENGYAAAHVVSHNKSSFNKDDHELRIGFDFDGVLADDTSERVYQRKKLSGFNNYEIKLKKKAHNPGPIIEFLRAICRLRQEVNGNGRTVRVAIFTARGAPAHERMINTIRNWGLIVDETFFLGGLKKAPFIEVFKADIYFDDQIRHLTSATQVCTAYVPYGKIKPS